jgi:hypothetical protein
MFTQMPAQFDGSTILRSCVDQDQRWSNEMCFPKSRGSNQGTNCEPSLFQLSMRGIMLSRMAFDQENFFAHFAPLSCAEITRVGASPLLGCYSVMVATSTGDRIRRNVQDFVLCAQYKRKIVARP